MNSGLKSYKDLELWKVSMDLVVDVYELTTRFPKEEIYGLTSQIRRSCSSIPSNIAEGASRKGTKEFIHFLWVANGSLSELETQIELAKRLGYINQITEIFEKIKYIRKMLHGLISSLHKKMA